MSEIFKKMKSYELPIAVYYKTSGSFAAGYVEETDDDFVCMRFLSPSGRFDGFHCIRTDEILKMDVGTEYLQDLDAVRRYRGEKEPTLRVSSKNLLNSFLDLAQKNKWLCTFEVGFEDLEKVSGYVVQKDWDTVEVSLLDEHGNADGYTSFDVDAIVYVGVQSDCENYMSTLALLKSGGEQKPKGVSDTESSGGHHTKEKHTEEKEKTDEQVISFPFRKK